MSHLKSRRRADYLYFLSYRTRWSDNDQYSHVNNSTYNLWFDSIVNTYLIECCSLDPPTSKSIGLVISSYCESFAPLSFPQVVDLGLRVNKLGSSSVTYEVGVFPQGGDEPSAVGGYTHVFVEREARRSTPMPSQVRKGLSNLFLEDARSSSAKL